MTEPTIKHLPNANDATGSHLIKAEPTLQQMAQRIVEINGGCWHETLVGTGDGKKCKGCGAYFDYMSYPVNPTFTDDAGKIKLLRLMMGREDWELFASSLFESAEEDMTILGKYLTETTGKILRVAYWFLMGGEK